MCKKLIVYFDFIRIFGRFLLKDRDPRRGVQIIGSACVSATNMVIFTVSVIGTAYQRKPVQVPIQCLQNLMHAKERIAAKSY